jgi:hypothetical protein
MRLFAGEMPKTAILASFRLQREDLACWMGAAGDHQNNGRAATGRMPAWAVRRRASQPTEDCGKAPEQAGKLLRLLTIL